VYSLDSDGTRTDQTVSSIDPSNGEFELASAPTQDNTYYVTYRYCFRRVDTPDTLVKLAALMLSAHYAYDKINIGKAKRFRMTNITVFRHMEAGMEYFQKYQRILTIINDRALQGILEANRMPADIQAMLAENSISGVMR
jgi:hypothetical protein